MVVLFGMFICLWFYLVKDVWEPWHYVLPEEKEDKDDSQDNEESTVVRTTAILRHTDQKVLQFI